MPQLSFRLNRFLLAIVNLLYGILAISLFIISTYCYFKPKLLSLGLFLGLIVISLFLLVLSFLGILGAYSHSHVILFFYSLLMLFCFIIQYALSIACLAAAHRDLVRLITLAWNKLDVLMRIHVMEHYQCCALNKDDYVNHWKNYTMRGEKTGHQAVASHCFPESDIANQNQPFTINQPPQFFECGLIIEQQIDNYTTWVGNVSLIFSFIEIFGVWLSLNFRNHKDPFSTQNYANHFRESMERNRNEVMRI